ncbi:uncharacterized protein BDR25DRAFT_385603 [Lindgomyces ingoldianus]|uniref:Uncharacterized protein n=1 Tax=Lindgomyces ingoldianus TaxID=673940 RepID=A0ACB6R4F5_9PLEO|nr:uncharacterized protein BDR25DRAFT_385603 [Lindgomyces ingoldianus]KAF2474134.1 hypothetical protein BDR25DRAFT_385603 [Lindgomyces ingoldianus]
MSCNSNFCLTSGQANWIRGSDNIPAPIGFLGDKSMPTYTDSSAAPSSNSVERNIGFPLNNSMMAADNNVLATKLELFDEHLSAILSAADYYASTSSMTFPKFPIPGVDDRNGRASSTVPLTSPPPRNVPGPLTGLSLFDDMMSMQLDNAPSNSGTAMYENPFKDGSLPPTPATPENPFSDKFQIPESPPVTPPDQRTSEITTPPGILFTNSYVVVPDGWATGTSPCTRRFEVSPTPMGPLGMGREDLSIPNDSPVITVDGNGYGHCNDVGLDGMRGDYVPVDDSADSDYHDGSPEKKNKKKKAGKTGKSIGKAKAKGKARAKVMYTPLTVTKPARKRKKARDWSENKTPKKQQVDEKRVLGSGGGPISTVNKFRVAIQPTLPSPTFHPLSGGFFHGDLGGGSNIQVQEFRPSTSSAPGTPKPQSQEFCSRFSGPGQQASSSTPNVLSSQQLQFETFNSHLNDLGQKSSSPSLNIIGSQQIPFQEFRASITDPVQPSSSLSFNIYDLDRRQFSFQEFGTSSENPVHPSNLSPFNIYDPDHQQYPFSDPIDDAVQQSSSSSFNGPDRHQFSFREFGTLSNDQAQQYNSPSFNDQLPFQDFSNFLNDDQVQRSNSNSPSFVSPERQAWSFQEWHPSTNDEAHQSQPNSLVTNISGDSPSRFQFQEYGNGFGGPGQQVSSSASGFQGQALFQGVGMNPFSGDQDNDYAGGYDPPPTFHHSVQQKMSMGSSNTSFPLPPLNAYQQATGSIKPSGSQGIRDEQATGDVWDSDWEDAESNSTSEYTETPPSKPSKTSTKPKSITSTPKKIPNRKSRAPREKLLNWKDSDNYEMLLLGIVGACGEHNIRIPFAAAAEFAGFNKSRKKLCSSGMMQQALIKLKERKVSQGKRLRSLHMSWTKKADAGLQRPASRDAGTQALVDHPSNESCATVPCVISQIHPSYSELDFLLWASSPQVNM